MALTEKKQPSSHTEMNQAVTLSEVSTTGEHDPACTAPADPAQMGSPHTKAKPFSDTLLNIGFIAGLLLAGACLAMSGWYLHKFLTTTSTSIETTIISSKPADVSEDLLTLAVNARMMIARLALLSCGVLVGTSFGFLGFVLFLLGIKGEMDVELQSDDYRGKYRGRIARMSPGAFVILCATVLIAVCATRKTPFEYQKGQLETGQDKTVAPEEYSTPEPISDFNLF